MGYFKGRFYPNVKTLKDYILCNDQAPLDDPGAFIIFSPKILMNDQFLYRTNSSRIVCDIIK
jgi:hypothetical protein